MPKYPIKGYGVVPGSAGLSKTAPNSLLGVRGSWKTQPLHSRRLDQPGKVLFAQARPPAVHAQQQAGAPSLMLIEPEPSRGAVFIELKEGPMLHFAQGPKPEHVTQGDVSDCPLHAVLAAMAHATPEAIKGMILEQKADVFSKRDSDEVFLYWTLRAITVWFRGNSKVISSLLYFDSSGDLVYSRSPKPICWVSYIEKAYVALRNSNAYRGLTGMRADKAMEDLVGSPDIIDFKQNLLFSGGSDEPLTDKRLQRILGEATKCPTIAASLDKKSLPEIVAHHAYAVLGSSGGKVRLYNPHGEAAELDPHVELSLGKFKQAFGSVLRACP